MWTRLRAQGQVFSQGFKGSIGKVQRSGAHCPGCSLRGSWINCEGLKGSIDTGLTAQELRHEGFRVEGFNMCTGLRVYGQYAIKGHRVEWINLNMCSRFRAQGQD